MSEKPLIPLQPLLIGSRHPIFEGICNWAFADSYVNRLLRSDIPQRIKYSNARFWAYRDSQNEIVGFGVLDVCHDCRAWAGKNPHAYIPLLAVRPDRLGLGHGGSLLQHLIDEATILANLPGTSIHDVLFLDVYQNNLPAIRLYEKKGFVKLTDQAIVDPVERQGYFIMAKRIVMSPPGLFAGSPPVP